ncbi:MAG: branched-chain amino acid ABC transporter permease, partial [Microcystis sp.]
VGPVVGGIVLTALPEVLRALVGVNGLPIWLGNFLRDGRLIIFGILIVLGTIFYPQGLITPQLIKKLIFFKRRSSLSQVDS